MGLTIPLAYYVGWVDGQRQVEVDCKFYNKHGIDGTESMNCFLDPDPFTIKIIDTQVGKKGNKPWVKK